MNVFADVVHAAGSAIQEYIFIDLRQIGRLSCRRASVVEFNLETQLWEVRTPEFGIVLFSNPSRQTCLDWELANLQYTS